MLVEHVEQNLGQGRLTVLFEYPAEAALARTKAADPSVAERFEIYACGVELANGFGELTDAGRAAPRFRRRHRREATSLRRALPARRGVPRRGRRDTASSGVALGFNRLAMLAAGAPGRSGGMDAAGRSVNRART